jgi:molecular chaperone DnaK (HSP70)
LCDQAFSLLQIIGFIIFNKQITEYKSNIEVRAALGNTELGWIDFDNRLIEFVRGSSNESTEWTS